MPLFYLLIIILIQTDIPLKASREFEVITNYELHKKPDAEHPRIVFEEPEEKHKSTGTDLLPYLSLKIKVKSWADGVTQIKITDHTSKLYLKKKTSDNS